MKETRMKELVEKLNKASNAYYNQDEEIMSNYEYDKLYDELEALEKETGMVFPNSPTQRAGYTVVDGLKKEEHATPALSLDKTKDVSALASWLGEKEGVLSWKMDGLTVVVNYSNGRLVKAVTRGNGLIGENITHNAEHFRGLPKEISFKGNLVIRGEAVISYAEFNRINETLEEQYKNPRNLASGTVRALDASVNKDRKVDFCAFQVLEGSELNSFSARLEWIKKLGFTVVENEYPVTANNLAATIKKWEKKIEMNPYPTDGLVLEYDDIAYGESLGSTGHHPRYGMAFKWQDEVHETKLLDIEWSASRTGLINPVAVFEPVEIEGTTVQRASVHNVSVMESFGFCKGDAIGVFKANLIIPQIAENISKNENDQAGRIIIEPPKTCPVCGSETIIKTSSDGIRTLWCENKYCGAKHIGSFERFVDRDAMNIEGLSTATLQAFVERGFVSTPADLYYLENHKDKIITLDGFGEKSYENIIKAIEKSKTTTFERYLYHRTVHRSAPGSPPDRRRC